MHLITRTPKLGLQLIRPSIFKDHRGEYTETYNQQEILPGQLFIQDSVIMSTKGVLRGYHGDDRTLKLVTCLQGAFKIVILCIDPEDDRFLQYDELILDDKERLSVVIPPKFVNAHQCLTDTCLFFYKQTTFYKGQNHQYSIRWDSIGSWPLQPVLSKRDSEEAHYFWFYVDAINKRLKAPDEANK